MLSHQSDFGYDEVLLQKAVTFLTTHFERTGNNPKPVVMHSLRVAALLWANGAPQDSVVAAILHDILEDTAVTESEMESKFGERITKIVVSLTIHNKKGSYAQRLKSAKRSYESSVELGADAVIVRASDLIDNSHYYKQAGDQQLKQHLVAKYVCFMKIAKASLEPTIYWELLEQAFAKNVLPIRRALEQAIVLD